MCVHTQNLWNEALKNLVCIIHSNLFLKIYFIRIYFLNYFPFSLLVVPKLFSLLCVLFFFFSLINNAGISIAKSLQTSQMYE